jgi:hypothetical protein
VNAVSQIENAVREIAQAQQCFVKAIHWVPKLKSSTSSPSDEETEKSLAILDSDHVKTAWGKALSRRQNDSDGALTVAKTLLESVCKHILTECKVPYPQNPEIGELYHLVSKQLKLSPEDYIDKKIKGILGNCQAVVQGVAFLRNKLSDAHSLDPNASPPEKEVAELAVNLAGAVSTFLVRHWEKHKNNRTNS